MFCKKCGNEISDGSTFCPVCGQLVNDPGSIRQPPTNPNVMSTAQTQYVAITSNKNRTTAIILCLIGFVGLGGLHRFYVGKIISGIIYLCTAGFVGIGTVIDLIQLLLGQFTDNVGAPLRR